MSDHELAALRDVRQQSDFHAMAAARAGSLVASKGLWAPLGNAGGLLRTRGTCIQIFQQLSSHHAGLSQCQQTLNISRLNPALLSGTCKCARLFGAMCGVRQLDTAGLICDSWKQVQHGTCLVGEEVTGSKDLVAAKGMHGLHLQRMDVSGQRVLLSLPSAALPSGLCEPQILRSWQSHTSILRSCNSCRAAHASLLGQYKVSAACLGIQIDQGLTLPRNSVKRPLKCVRTSVCAPSWRAKLPAMGAVLCCAMRALAYMSAVKVAS